MLVKSLSVLAIGGLFCFLPPNSPAPASELRIKEDMKVWSGPLMEWFVSGRGVIFLRLEMPGSDGDPATPMWFRTPGDRSGSTQFEDLVLRLILDTPGQAAIHIHAERDAEGVSRESAITIEGLASTGRSD